jgi:hypothetical protein
MIDLIRERFIELRDQRIRSDNAFSLAKSTYKNNGEWAAALAATKDTKSKGYKAALRNVERWTTSSRERRTPSRKTLERLAELLRQDDRAIDQTAPGLIAVVSGRVKVSEDARFRTVEIPLDDAQTAEVIKTVNRGQDGHAYDLLWEAYGVIPDSVENARMTFK